MKTIEIIDHLGETKNKPKPIELLGCLQSTTDDGKPNFSCDFKRDEESWAIPYGASKIERVFSQRIDGENYDIIIVHRHNSPTVLYIGKWNDGVLP